MVKRNAIATKLTKRCTQTQKRAFDVAVSMNKVNRVGRVERGATSISDGIFCARSLVIGIIIPLFCSSYIQKILDN